MREAWNAAPDGILLVNSDGLIISSNAAMSLISGYAQGEMEGSPVEMLLPDSMRTSHRMDMRQFFAHPRRHSMGLGRTLWLQRKDGGQIPVDIALGNFDRAGSPLAVAFVRDVTEMRRMEERMQYQATHDVLTGLLNRWSFNQRLHESLQHAQVSGDTPE